MIGSPPRITDRIEQSLAGFDIGDDRTARKATENFGGQDLQQLVAEHDPAFAVDHADSIAVTVEGDPELGTGFANGLDQVLEILGDRRVRVVIGKATVDVGIEQMMLAGKAFGQGLERFAAGAVAGIPRPP